jgi:adenylate cyclase
MMTGSTIQRLRLLALMVVASAIAGGLYSVFQAPPHVRWSLPVLTSQFANGVTIGTVISLCIMGFELFGAGYLLERNGRRVPFLVAIALRMLVYGIITIAALVVFPWLLADAPLSLFRPGMVGDIIFSFAVAFFVVWLTSVAQLIGPNILASLLTGRYYHPREEDRIVLFLDLVGSTELAERMGNVAFHALLSETFTRLSRVVTDWGGEVYRYVGDAMIATWPLRTPKENARTIACLFECREALRSASADLEQRHGQVPAFRASVHAGPLVAGEIGGFKREIALLGDAMNTAARIEQACRTVGSPLLVSKPMLDRTLMPAGIVAISLGSHLLRGKADRLELFALEGSSTGRL